MPPSSTRRGCSACPWPRSPTLPKYLLAISGAGAGSPSIGWWPDMPPSGLDPARQGTCGADPSGSPPAARTARLSGPWSRTDIPQPRQEGGNPTLPDEGDTMMTDTQLLLSVEEGGDPPPAARRRPHPPARRG